MKIFSTKVHGFLDYLVGIVLLGMPAILKLDYANTESQVFFVLGGTLLFYSLLTRYELGLIKVIPMGAHLALDVLSGMFLAASPWIFGFEDRIFIPYLVLGVAEMTAGLTTTSKVGVPEVQEIIATEPIHTDNVKEKPIITSNHRTETPSGKPAIAAKSTTVVSKKTTESKKPKSGGKISADNNKPSSGGKKANPGKKTSDAKKHSGEKKPGQEK